MTNKLPTAKEIVSHYEQYIQAAYAANDTDTVAALLVERKYVLETVRRARGLA